MVKIPPFLHLHTHIPQYVKRGEKDHIPHKDSHERHKFTIYVESMRENVIIESFLGIVDTYFPTLNVQSTFGGKKFLTCLSSFDFQGSNQKTRGLDWNGKRNMNEDLGLGSLEN